MEVRAGVLTLSDRSSRGEYEDLSGPAIREIFDARPEFEMAWEQVDIIPDEEPLIIEIIPDRPFHGSPGLENISQCQLALLDDLNLSFSRAFSWQQQTNPLQVLLFGFPCGLCVSA